MTGLQAAVIGPEQVTTLGAEWDELHNRSDADPLFMSRDWQERWRSHHAAAFGLRQFGLTARTPDGLLAGLACFHRRRVTHGPGLQGDRIELAGNLWRTRDTVRSERLGFIVDSAHPDAYDTLAEALIALPGWMDMVIANADLDGATVRAIRQAAVRRRLYQRSTDETVAYALDLTAGFASLVASLSAKTRRKVLHDRHRLSPNGDAVWETAPPGEIEEYFDSLDLLHEARWGWKASRGRRGRLYREYVEQAGSAGRGVLSRLRIGRRVVAVSLDFRVAGVQYGIQTAVDVAFSRQLSVGLLHAGFNLENACAAGVRRFDFLSGEGRHEDYKKRLGASTRTLGCLQLIRAPVLGRLHRVADGLGRDRLLRWFPQLRPGSEQGAPLDPLR